jgi:hypothetical protein
MSLELTNFKSARQLGLRFDSHQVSAEPPSGRRIESAAGRVIASALVGPFLHLRHSQVVLDNTDALPGKEQMTQTSDYEERFALSAAAALGRRPIHVRLEATQALTIYPILHRLQS